MYQPWALPSCSDCSQLYPANPRPDHCGVMPTPKARARRTHVMSGCAADVFIYLYSLFFLLSVCPLSDWVLQDGHSRCEHEHNVPVPAGLGTLYRFLMSLLLYLLTYSKPYSMPDTLTLTVITLG